MRRSDSDPPDGPTAPSRRALLKLGAGAAGAAIGVAGLSGSAAAWKRLDVDFRSEREVWLLVGRDLDYDPPAVVHVVVERGGDLECRAVELSRENAKAIPEAGDTSVVPYEVAEGETVRGVLPYNRSPGTDDRFDRPRCFQPNDQLDDARQRDGLDDADCLQAATDTHWNGEVNQCWWEPVDVGGFDLRQVARLAPADGQADDRFGESIAANSAGDVVLVGAPGSYVPGTDSDGAAYVFTERVGTYVQTARFTPEAADGADEFGAAVDLNDAGDVALVGRPGEGPEAAVVFERRDSGWVKRATLSPPEDDERLRFGGFGDAVALDATGETAIVGAPSTYGGDAYASGSALLFEREDDGWSEPATLAHRFGADNYYGASVAINDQGSVGLVGAPAYNATGDETDGGWINAVRRTDDGWKRTTRLQADDQRSGDFLGTAVDCDAECEIVVAGRPGGDSPPDQREHNSAMAFGRTPKGWREAGTLEAPTNTHDDFGSTVAVDADGRLALVGAPGRDTGAGTDAGSVHLYTRKAGEWHQRTRAVADNGTTGDAFGSAVDLTVSGKTAVVGTPGVDNGDPGTAYVFELD